MPTVHGQTVGPYREDALRKTVSFLIVLPEKCILNCILGKCLEKLNGGMFYKIIGL